MKKRRASTSSSAREYRQAGHNAAKQFALTIGMGDDYRRDPKAKKDVIDPAGDAHSVKAGKKKWQIFLYTRSRLATDDGFQSLNGVGQLLVHCIDVFPPMFEDYEESKDIAKERLRTPMRERPAPAKGTPSLISQKSNIQWRRSQLSNNSQRR